MPFVQKRTVLERLTAKSMQSGDCLLYTGEPMKNGYCTISVNGRKQLVHRMAYQEYHGSIPTDVLVRHTCDVRNCFARDHLITGTHADNTGDMLTRQRSRRHTQKACKHGHARTPENRHVTSRGSWDCKPCRQRRGHDQWERQKANRVQCPHCDLITTTNYLGKHIRRKHS
jgi:hypothetical protein